MPRYDVFQHCDYDWYGQTVVRKDGSMAKPTLGYWGQGDNDYLEVVAIVGDCVWFCFGDTDGSLDSNDMTFAGVVNDDNPTIFHAELNALACLEYTTTMGLDVC